MEHASCGNAYASKARHTAIRRLRHGVAGIVLAALMAGAVSAAEVTVDGSFTSFSTWMFDPSVRLSYVNNTLLTSSGTVVGNNGAINYYLSNPVTLTAPTTTVDFIYGSAGFTPPFPLPNSMEFIPNSSAASVALGETFQLGTFRFTNGQWYPEAEFGFRLTTHSTDPTLDGHAFTGVLHLTSVSSIPQFVNPLEDARAEADYFYVVGRPDLGSARVYDLISQPPGNPGNAGEFAFNGYISSIHPTGFAALTNGGFTDPSVQPTLTNPIPEPEVYVMITVGLGLVGWKVRRRIISSGSAPQLA